jgi:hypothetical protein
VGEGERIVGARVHKEASTGFLHPDSAESRQIMMDDHRRPDR